MSNKKPTASVTPPQKKKLLHVGCGESNPAKLPAAFRTPEWQEVRVDIDERVKPDIVASMIDMRDVPTGGFDAVFSSHNLEHLHHHQLPLAFAEFLRVLKSGGMLMVTMPDIQAISAYIADGRLENKLYDSPAGPISPIDIVYGWRKAIADGNKFMAHNTAFSAVSLAKHLKESGFSTVKVQREWVNLWAVAYNLPKGHPQRREMPVIENKDIKGPQDAPLPWWYQRQLQLQENPDIRSDELDAPPKLWKPLGLKKSG